MQNTNASSFCYLAVTARHIQAYFSDAVRPVTLYNVLTVSLSPQSSILQPAHSTKLLLFLTNFLATMRNRGKRRGGGRERLLTPIDS